MPEENQILIELKLETKKLKKDLDSTKSDIAKFAKKASDTTSIAKAIKDLTKSISDLGKIYKSVSSEAQKSYKKQEEGAKKATDSQRKLNKELKDSSKTMKDMEKIGFFRGFARGSGLSGVGQAISAPNRMGRMGGALGRAGTGLVGKAIGFGVGAMQQSYGTYMQHGQARFGMAGLGISRGGLGAGRRAMGVGASSLGYGPIERATMDPMGARLTGAGVTDLGAVLAQGGGYGAGNVGEAMGMLGTMRQAGQRFQTGGQQRGAARNLTKMIADGMSTGLEKARLPEYFQGIRALTARQMGRASGVVDMGQISRSLALVGSTGKAGLTDARGAQVAQTLDAMITKPGGGESGQAVMLQALGFGKPGGQASYYEALKQQQKGISGEDSGNLRAIFKEVNLQRGVVGAGGSGKLQQEANLQLHVMSGLSLQIVEDLQEILNSGESQEEQEEKIKETLKKTKPIQEQALEASKEGFSKVKKHLSRIEGIQIKIGEKIAPVMMALQAAQMDLALEMSKLAPAIAEGIKEIAHFIKESYHVLKGGFSKLLFRDDSTTLAYDKFTKELDESLKDVKKELFRTPERAVSALRSKAAKYEKEAAQIRKKGVEGEPIFGATGLLQQGVSKVGMGWPFYMDSAVGKKSETRSKTHGMKGKELRTIADAIEEGQRRLSPQQRAVVQQGSPDIKKITKRLVNMHVTQLTPAVAKEAYVKGVRDIKSDAERRAERLAGYRKQIEKAEATGREISKHKQSTTVANRPRGADVTSTAGATTTSGPRSPVKH